ncbi:hypothetical protein G6F68_016744 [Rhizopus microsporus]|nr:hypothetical protein G6F68_016744 [Rhizopus microsporus]
MLTSTDNDALQLQVSRTLDNSGGTVGANGALDINGGILINDGGKLIAAGTGTSRIHARQQMQNQRGAWRQHRQQRPAAVERAAAGPAEGQHPRP